MTIKSITSGQEKQFKRFVEDAAERALKEVGLNKDGLQKLIEHGDEFQTRIITGIRELSVSNQFADEEVESNYSYPSDYKKPKPIEEQIAILRDYWPKLEPTKQIIQLERKPLLSSAEGLFAIVCWQALAPTYSEALENEVLEAIKIQRNGKLYNYRKGQLGPEHLRQYKRTVKMLQQISEVQKGDILAVSAQFGIRHRGRSVRRAREVFMANEFGLGALATGSMLLSHPERLQHYNDLCIDCAGDEYSPGAGGRFVHVPYFYFHDGQVLLVAFLFDGTFVPFGSASGFLPQY